MKLICPYCGAEPDAPPKTLALCHECFECLAFTGPLFADKVSVLEMPQDTLNAVRAEQARRRAERGRIA